MGIPVVAAIIFSVAYGFYMTQKTKPLQFYYLSWFCIVSIIKGYISIIFPLLVCGGLNLLYNGDKIKITNPKKAFIELRV